MGELQLAGSVRWHFSWWKERENVRIADGTVLIANSEEKLQALVSKLNDDCESKGLKIDMDRQIEWL